MIIAINKNNEQVNANVACRDEKYYCPSCKKPVVLKNGLSKSAHFSHQKQFNCSIFSDGESNEHLLGKRQIINFFKSANFKNIKLEFYLSSIKQRPDILIHNLAIEFQCSQISNRRLKERIDGYHKINIKSWWILGAPYLNRKLSLSKMAQFIRYSHNLGFYIYYWATNTNSLIIHYQIAESNGHFSYRQINIYSYYKFILFIKHTQIISINVNLSSIKRYLKQLQRQLIYNDIKTSDVQVQCYLKNHSLIGCPLICHYPMIEMPILGHQILKWRILIILNIDTQINLCNLYYKTINQLNLSSNFIMINNIEKMYKITFNHFINTLIDKKYIKIVNNYVYLIKKFKWFNDYFEKINYINKIKKHHK